jgi:N utilization substance protein B
MKSNRRRNTPQNRSAARLAAVQALYGAELTGASADAVLADFLDHGIGPKALAGGVEGGASEAEVPLAEFDPQLFAGIVRGVLYAAIGRWTASRRCFGPSCGPALTN